MAELVLIDERIISGKGVLKVPEEARTSRYWIMYVDVIRRPRNEYLELQWNPNQSMYARMTYLRNSYVQTFDYIKFQREQRTYINDITGQNLRAIKCAYEGILQTFFNLGNALLLPSISVTNLIKDYESLALSWDEIRFSCYSNTALQIRFYGLQYDVCNTENDDSNDPPPPPPPRAQIPTEEPVEVSPPYDDGDDNGGTIPFPDDQFPPDDPEPPGERCTAYRVTVRIYGDWADPDGTIGGFGYKDVTSDFYGEVTLLPTTIRTIIRNYGIPFGSCLTESQDTVLSTQPSDPGYPPREIVGFEDITP